MGPERKDELRSANPGEAALQDHDGLLAESQRLIHEMALLLERARLLQEEQAAIIARIRTKKI